MKFADGDSIHRLISGCLALEDLVLDLPELPKNMSNLNIHSLSLKRLALDFLYMFTFFPLVFNYTFVINAPNLVYFKYAGPIAEGYCLSNMNSLEKADVEVYRLDDVNLESRAIAAISNLLQGLCNVKSLHFSLEQPEMLIRVPFEPVIGFHNLVEFELKTHKEYCDWQGTWVIQFLWCAPNLETLHLDLPVPLRGFKPLPEEVPPCLGRDIGSTKLFEESLNRREAAAAAKTNLGINSKGQGLSRRSGMKSVEDLDKISSLPDHILCHILSLLPTKDAVRTSVISPRWRYLFSSMPTLEFQYCLSSIHPRLRVENFKNFVDRLLFFPNHVTLECFRLYESSSRDDDYLRLYGWICAALRRDVKEIDIRYGILPVLPISLFTSRSLVTLKLDIHEDMKVPCKVCLPNLKSLNLKNIKFPDSDSIHRLISGCLTLEDLVMILPELPKNISKLDFHSLSLKRLALNISLNVLPLDFKCTFVINAPNLVYFKYDGPIAKGYCLSSMNSLEKAVVEVYQLDDEPSYDVNRESGATASISKLLQGICNVKSLRLSIDQSETLIQMPPEPVLRFHKLVELEIYSENHDWQGTWVIQFLCCAPNLETLHLDLPVPNRGFEPLPEEVPPCLSFRLKEIKIRYFEGNEHMFEMISYFLNHASVLEVLMIGIEEDEEYSNPSPLRNVIKLLGLPRNSKKCRVVAL
ncbi:hypothetical protein V6N12_072619 [Hibiscus sabdariffa]